MSADDLVLGIGGIGDNHPVSAPVRARDERRQERAERGPLQRMLRMRQVKMLAQNAARVRAGRAIVGAAQGGAAVLRGTATRAAGTPVGLAVAALLVAGVVALRLGAGEPLEGVGEKLNQMLLGDLDDEARAKMATREQITGDSDLTRIAAQEGHTNAQALSIASDLTRFAKQREVGASLLRREFPVNNALDLIILAGARAFMAAWNGNSGPAATRRLSDGYGRLLLSNGGKTSR